MANFQRPRMSFDPMDLTRLTLEGIDRKEDRLRWREAVERELAHDKRREDKESQLPPAPKLED